jgi:methyl-accepting chemotaxis protein
VKRKSAVISVLASRNYRPFFPKSTEEIMGRREELLEELEELDRTAAEEAATAVDTAHEAVGETADAAVETAQEAADTVTEAIVEVAEEVAETTGEPVDLIYSQIVSRLEAEGRLVAQVSENPGEIVNLDSVDEVVPEIIPDEIVAPGDEIHPRSEHGWYRKRRILGREI